MPSPALFAPASRRFLIPASLTLALLSAGFAVAQPKPARPAATPPQLATPAISEKDRADTQQQLIKLLRESPTLTTVVEHDPSLLANPEYVQRNNPQLAQFLTTHPEVALNPDYYLFNHLNDADGQSDGQRGDALERAVWPEYSRTERPRPMLAEVLDQAAPIIVFLGVAGALLWLTRTFLENRRWHRIFKLQMDVHGKLIDKFGTSQELLGYMETEAGKRFLEAAPLAVNFESDQRIPNAVARVLAPLQIGVVLSLLGIGFYMLRHAHREMEVPMLFMGTLAFMPGLGFIISAGITWMLAGRLGLMPGAGPQDGPHGRS